MTASARRATDRVHDDEGISLVEMIVAILIIGIILGAMASMSIASLRSVQSTERVTRATALGNELLERLQAIDFNDVGLYSTQATDHFGGNTFEGAKLVLVEDASPQGDVPYPEDTHTRAGVDYTVQTAITWVDDPKDGTGGSDEDGPEDYKRLTLDISWQLGDQTHSRRVESLRTPESEEEPLVVSIEPDLVYLDESGSGHKNDVPLYFSATTAETQNKVKVSFVRRDGTTDSFLMGYDNAAQTEWSHTMNAESKAFANGETLFTFETVATDGTTLNVTLGRVLFLQTLQIVASDVTVTTPSGVSSELEVEEGTGTYCDDEITFDVVAQGMTTSDPLDIELQGGARQAVPVVDSTIDGARYAGSFDTSGLTLAPGTDVPFTLEARRRSDTTSTTYSDSIPVVEVDSCT